MANRHRKGDVARASHPPIPAASAPALKPSAPPPPPIPTSPPLAAPAAPRLRAYRTPARTAKDEGQSPFVMRLGRLLRRARVRRCMSQEQLGAIAKLDRTHISLIECGRRNIHITTLCALATALRVNPCDIMPVLFLPDKAATTPPAPSAPATPPPPAHL